MEWMRGSLFLKGIGVQIIVWRVAALTHGNDRLDAGPQDRVLVFIKCDEVIIECLVGREFLRFLKKDTVRTTPGPLPRDEDFPPGSSYRKLTACLPR